LLDEQDKGVKKQGILMSFHNVGQASRLALLGLPLLDEDNFPIYLVL
jgi:hypothetical protein